MNFDITIIGAGIVGLATAYQLSERRPGLKIAILEKEKEVAFHQSGRNSGVIHSGIYYLPGGSKAVNCRRGYKALIEFCDRFGLPYDICGKVIVATKEQDSVRLEKVLQRGIANGLKGIRIVGPDEIKEIEPHVQAVAALWVPQAGIIDYPQLAKKYLELVLERGGEIKLGTKVLDIVLHGKEAVVIAENAEVKSRILINCAGLYSDKLAALTGSDSDIKILPFRGEFYELVKQRQYLVRNLIYPLPNPNFPFLGVHFTRLIGGGIEAGPNAVLAFRREGYSRWDVKLDELAETLAFPGFRKIAARYWREGLDEMHRSFSKRAFVKALQDLIPEVGYDDLKRGRSGVRAMACDKNGRLIDDFLILENQNVINVCNAPSPAATASLAIGERIAEKALTKY